MAIQAEGVREQEKGVNSVITSSTHSFNPEGNLRPLRATLSQGADFGVAAEEGALHLALAFFLHPAEPSQG